MLAVALTDDPPLIKIAPPLLAVLLERVEQSWKIVDAMSADEEIGFKGYTCGEDRIDRAPPDKPDEQFLNSHDEMCANEPTTATAPP